MTTTKPFLKWAGGKLLLVDTIKKHVPKETKRFIEPFLGAGSVSLNIDAQEHIVNDFNSDLIELWKELQTHGLTFISECEKMFIPENNVREVFDSLKREFNETADSFRKATLFVYLNRHCFNGLWRYNGSGKYNVPFGRYDKPYFPKKEFAIVLEKISNFQFYNKDFREIFEYVTEGDVIYCDPPYVPLSLTASFNSYSAGGFGLKDQIDLAECAGSAVSKGATVIISNHYNWYTKELYHKMHGGKIYKMDVKRTLSSKADERKAVAEILAVFTPKNNEEK